MRTSEENGVIIGRDVVGKGEVVMCQISEENNMVKGMSGEDGEVIGIDIVR